MSLSTFKQVAFLLFFSLTYTSHVLFSCSNIRILAYSKILTDLHRHDSLYPIFPANIVFLQQEVIYEYHTIYEYHINEQHFKNNFYIFMDICVNIWCFWQCRRKFAERFFFLAHTGSPVCQRAGFLPLWIKFSLDNWLYFV